MSNFLIKKKYMYILHGFFVDVSILSRAKIEIKIFKWNKIFSLDCTFQDDLSLYIRKRLSIRSIKMIRHINLHGLTKYSLSFSIRCSVY